MREIVQGFVQGFVRGFVRKIVLRVDFLFSYYTENHIAIRFAASDLQQIVRRFV
jgi:hypothetical protein